MNDWLLAVLVLVGVLFLWDVWRLVRKWSAAVDRDQDIMDRIVEVPITNHVDADDVEEVAMFDIDITMDERDATLAFIENFRRMKEEHDRNS